MIITKPDHWCWEFTSVTKEQKQLNDIKIKCCATKQRKWVNAMKTKRCTKCNINAVNSELFTASKSEGLFCERCRHSDDLFGQKFRHAFGRPFYK